jgi:hypothetical protein
LGAAFFFAFFNGEGAGMAAGGDFASAGCAVNGLADAGLADAGLADAGLADAGLDEAGLVGNGPVNAGPLSVCGVRTAFAPANPPGAPRGASVIPPPSGRGSTRE